MNEDYRDPEELIVSFQYILDENGSVVPEPDIIKWSAFFGDFKKRIVKQEQIGRTFVSTVFLGINHNFGDSAEPVLWETMAFGGKLDQAQTRCSGNLEQAEAMHEIMAATVRNSEPTKMLVFLRHFLLAGCAVNLGFFLGQYWNHSYWLCLWSLLSFGIAAIELRDWSKKYA